MKSGLKKEGRNGIGNPIKRRAEPCDFGRLPVRACDEDWQAVGQDHFEVLAEALGNQRCHAVFPDHLVPFCVDAYVACEYLQGFFERLDSRIHG